MRHSMLKMRLGAVPLTDVKTPNPLLTVYRSSQYGKMAYMWLALGRQVLAKTEVLLPNCNVPLESTFAVVKLWSYSV